MRNLRAVPLAIAVIASAAGLARAKDAPLGIDPARLRPGARVKIRTGAVVDLPDVVMMRLMRSGSDISVNGRIVAQSRWTLTVCPPGCAQPVVVVKPETKLKAVVLAVESGTARLELEDEPYVVALLPLAAVADVRMIASSPSGYPGSATLIGKRVAVDVGNVVQIETGDNAARAPRAVDIDGAPFTEVPNTAGETPLLLPAPESHLEGHVAADDGDTITVRLLGREQLVSVPRTAVTALRVQRRRSWASRGALIGAGVGLAAGLGTVLVAETTQPCAPEDYRLCAVVDALLTATTAAGGSIIGAVAGAMTHTDHWESADNPRWRMAVAPDRHGGVRGRLSVRF